MERGTTDGTGPDDRPGPADGAGPDDASVPAETVRPETPAETETPAQAAVPALRARGRVPLGTLGAIAIAVVLVAGAVLAAFAATGRLALPGRCAPADDGCLRVLFVGNSYTYVNDLPGTVADLVRAGGTPIEVGMAAVGGATLADHVSAPATAATLSSAPWSVVVLQEQSMLPASPSYRTSDFIPAVGALRARVASTGARTLLFETWAHREGWPEEGLVGYGRMQQAIDEAYAQAALATGTTVVPVGEAWFAALSADPGMELWQADGSHPAPAGTYLAACVFYAVLTGRTPVGLPARPGVSDEVAHQLQRIAASTVLGDAGGPEATPAATPGATPEATPAGTTPDT